MTMPRPVRLFHITAIDNLANICKNSSLISKNQLDERGSNIYYNIAHSSCQDRRATKFVPDPPGGCLHDYVPFYFAPRSPMLCAIHKRNVQNCDYAQTDIIYFELTIENALEESMTDYVFYDINATLALSVPCSDLNQLHTHIDWAIITESPALDGFCKYFVNKPENPRYINRMEKRQAEFLIKNQVPLNWFTKIGVADPEAQQKVISILQQHNINLKVEIKTDWYF